MATETYTRPPGQWWLHAGSWSVLLHKRSVLAGSSLLLITLAVAVLALSRGAIQLSPVAAVNALLGHGSQMDQFVVRHLRLERVIAGLVAGFAFGVTGCLLQTLARNRLATPGIIGIDNGATAFAVASIVAVPTSLAPPALALVGAAVSTALTFGLSGGAGGRGYRFIVVGIGVGALFGALTNLMLAHTDMDSANAAYPWTVGSLNSVSSTAVKTLSCAILITFPVLRLLARQLAAMRFSPAVAVGLGVPLGHTRVLTLIVTVLLTALAVAVAGPVGLISLAAPEVARYLCGQQRVPLLVAGIAGMLLMVSADLTGRLMLSPIEVPVGVITAVVGGPYLLWILLRQPARG